MFPPSWHALVFLVPLAAICLISAQVAAMQISYTTQDNQPPHGDPPSVTVMPTQPVWNATFTVERDGRSVVEETYDHITPEEGARVEIDQTEGTRSYRARLEGTDQQGSDVGASFEFDLRVAEALDVSLIRDAIDLDQGALPIEITHRAERIELEVQDGEGQSVVHETLEGGFEAGRVDLSWDADGRAIAGARVTVHHASGQWVSHTLEPFSVELPQQIIRFETGTATIRDTEEEKLQEAKQALNEQLEKHGDDIDGLRLYVAGYTDTVGDADMNLRLSQQRARALARWFRDQGVELPIYFQGFGQESLAVDTPDQTEEERNRRALYILSNTPPPRSDDILRDDWRPLP